VRLSIGASRARVIRQLLTESLLLVAIAAAAGITAANPGSSLLVRAALGSSPSGSPITASLDWRVLGFTLAASILTGLLCGVVPALRATDVQLDAAKKLGTRGLSAESR
jgi:ABC-type antimicrobial peptide transport system permease subunit